MRPLAGAMPKSRGRQRKTSRPTRRGRTQVSAEDRARAAANLPIVQRVDTTESRGDVHAALWLLEEDLGRRPDSEVFWRSDRVKHLMQLAAYQSVLPSWAYSRWILEQAVRWMDASQRGRVSRAYDQTVRIAGGPERYSGVDDIDSSCKLMDHDWVYRQLVLYEYGGLQHFLDKVASRSLIARADRIRGWARTPMGAYRLVGQSARAVTWWDLANERETETLNIGSASLVAVGEHVIGRLVTTEVGPLFESVPIVVPPDVAAQVAADPHDWMAALECGCHRDTTPEETISTQVTEFPLLSDVPPALEHVLIDQVVCPDEAEALRWSADDLKAAQVAVVSAALEDSLDVGGAFEPWPVVGA